MSVPQVTPNFKQPREKRARDWRTGLTWRSEKRAAETDARAVVRDVTLKRANYRCQAAGLTPVECGGPLDVHELAPRSAYPGGHLDITNTVAICRSCHDWTGDHPAEAHALGLHRFSWEVERCR